MMSQSDLIETVKHGDLSSVTALIASGADVNQQDRQGWTALNWAAGRGDVPLVRALVENGADVLKTGIDQRTPAMIAIAAGQVETARFLIEAEAARPDYAGEAKRQYCAAFHVKDLRQFPAWRESSPDVALADGAIVYLHEDLHVTRSIWPREDVVFDHGSQEWRQFCTEVLSFAPPSDLELIVAAQNSGAASGESV